MSLVHSDIFKISSQAQFEELAIRAFRYQAAANPVYGKFLEALNTEVLAVQNVEEIPFLPIEFFKTNDIIAGNQPLQKTFSSSGTTGSITSLHHVTDLKLYENSFHAAFQQFYGNPSGYCILALLPSYLERSGSSLIYMTEKLIAASSNPDSGFYLNDLDALREKINQNEAAGQKTLLLGVSYALLDLLEKGDFTLKNTIVMETGGMKGRRKEMVREELHSLLCEGFGISTIHSEYGMTELLSQAYSDGNGIFTSPAWMKILIRDANDPFSYLPEERAGGINVIDLANINSCCFIATQDLGRLKPENRFEVIGRFDNSDIRGCNLLAM
jgi:phenylacetate-coenzyme A ligase PaaK-like adenylate-forming protein